jgi:hypothetical protein
MTDSELNRRVAEIRASGRPLEEVLDELILEPDAFVLDVIRMIMRAYDKRLLEAKGLVEVRCYELTQAGKKKPRGKKKSRGPDHA